jgi:hypothetical protein
VFVQYPHINQARWITDVNFHHWRWFKSRCVSTKLVLIYILRPCKLFQDFLFSCIAKKYKSTIFLLHSIKLQRRFHLASSDFLVGKILRNYYYNIRSNMFVLTTKYGHFVMKTWCLYIFFTKQKNWIYMKWNKIIIQCKSL